MKSYDETMSTLHEALNRLRTIKTIESLKDYREKNPTGKVKACIPIDLCKDESQKEELEKLLLQINENYEFIYSPFLESGKLVFLPIKDQTTNKRVV